MDRDEMVANDLVDEWLIEQSESTRKIYITVFDKFLNHFNTTPEELLNEAQSTSKSNHNKRGLKVKKKLNQWYAYLMKDEKKALNTARGYENAVKSFLTYHGSQIKTKKREDTTTYERKVLRNKDVRTLIEGAKNYKQKLLICFAFQSGMSISDLLALDYKNVKKAVKHQIAPFMIKYIRKKTKTKGKAIFGRDTLDFLTQYLEARERLGETFANDTPLFTGENSGERLKEGVTQRNIKKIAIKTGLISPDEIEEYQNFNPVGFGALRTGFISTGLMAGLPRVQLDIATAHKLPFGGAYDKYKDEELIENYRNAEEHFSMYSDIRDQKETITDLQKQLNEKDRQIEELKDALVERNGRDKNRDDEIDAIKQQLEEMKRVLQEKTKNL